VDEDSIVASLQESICTNGTICPEGPIQRGYVVYDPKKRIFQWENGIAIHTLDRKVGSYWIIVIIPR
jgi:hypothetical protein